MSDTSPINKGKKYTLVPSPRFVRDYKYYQRKHFPLKNFRYVLSLLEYHHANFDEFKKFDDHALTGSEAGNRELHLSGNTLIKYQVHNQEVTLVLLRLGTHHGKRGVFK